MFAHVREDGFKQRLEDHLSQVALLAGEHAEKINLRGFGEIAGLIHDFGKYSSLFQRYLLSATGIILSDDEAYVDFKKLKGKVDHSTAGAQLVHKIPQLSSHVKELIEAIVVSHHGGLIDFVSPEGLRPLIKKIEKEVGIEDLLKDEVQISLTDLVRVAERSEIEKSYKEHIELLKKSKNQDVFMFMLGMTVKFLFSCLVDADRSDTISFSSSHLPDVPKHLDIPWEKVNEAIEAKITKYEIKNEIDEFRQKISEECLKSAIRPKGIYRLTVPTGGGKTLSSLRFAVNHAKVHGLDRIVYVIPFTSIIDQNAEVVRSLLKEKGLEEILLEHHSNITDEENTSQNQIYSENWSAQIIYTTMVQFLETLFSGGTGSVRRLHNLANSVLIFDEIQTIGVKNIFIFNMAIRYLSEVCGSTILLCTATQPVLDHSEFSPFTLNLGEHPEISESIQAMDEVFRRVEPHDYTERAQWVTKDTANLAIAEHLKRKSVLVIVNTKAAASEIANVFEEGGYDYYHLSTNMCPVHRLQLIQEMKGKLETNKDSHESPVICVSTQLIEAGVDIDFNVVIRHLAGLDSLIQAAGRCNRSGRMQSKGKLFIVDPVDESLKMLPDIKKGRDVTLRIIRELRSKNKSEAILETEAILKYFDYYYYQRKEEMSYKIALKKHGVEETIVNLLSKNERSVNAARRRENAGGIIFPHAFETAGKFYKVIDSNSKGVIVPYMDGKEIIIELCSTTSEHATLAMLKRAQHYSVNLYEHQIQSLFKEGGLHETQTGSGVFYLNEAFYHKKYGVVLKGQSNAFLLI